MKTSPYPAMKFHLLSLGLLASSGRAFSPTLATSSSALDASSAKQTIIATSDRSTTSTSQRMISSLFDLMGGGGGAFDKSQLIRPERALRGRSQKMPNIDSLRHYVLGNKIDYVPEGHQVAVFANGVSSPESDFAGKPLRWFDDLTLIWLSMYCSASGDPKRASGDCRREFIRQLLDIVLDLHRTRPMRKPAVE